MTTAKEERHFESINSYHDLYLESLKGKELSPIDILLHELVGGLLQGTEKISPVGSRESDWIEEGGKTYGLSYSERNTMYDQCDRLLRADPLMLNAHKRFLIHICGKGPKVDLIKIDGEKHPLAKRLKKLIPDFPSLAQYIVSYTLKFGELFALHLPIENNDLGRPTWEILAPNRCRKIHVKTPLALGSKIIKYNFPALRKAVANGMIPPDAITMFRVHEDLNDGLHGLSLYYVAMKELTRYTDWLHSRGLRARANSIFIILRALKGASAGERHEIPDKPMIIDTHMGKEEWKTIEGTASARDASADGYEFRIRAIQGTGLPEPEVSGSPQYAAQMRQGYSTRLYEYYQRAFNLPLKTFVAKTLGLDDDSEIILTWPIVDPRERTQRVAEVSTLARDRQISRGELHRRLEYDHDLVEQELKDELQEEASRIPPATQLALPLGGPGIPMPEGAPPVGSPPAPVEGGPLEVETPAPEIETALPSGMLHAATRGVRPDEILDENILPERLVLGIDYGYARNGAIVLGGPVDNGIAVIGEIRLHRAPLRGEKSWESALTELKTAFPEIEMAYAGADAPELIDLLKELGFEVKAMKLGSDEVVKKIDAYHHQGKSFMINSRCERLVSELFPDEADAKAEGHVRPSADFWDAFRYLFMGLQGATND